MSVQPFTWTRERFLRIADAGGFGNKKAELLGTEVFLMSPGRAHQRCTMNLERIMKGIFPPDQWAVTREYSIDVRDESLPLPDIAIFPFPDDELFLPSRGLPKATDAALIVEVADRSYRHDRREKLPRYAAEGVPYLWIVRLSHRRVETYREPALREGRYDYLPGRAYGEKARAPLIIDGREIARVRVADILKDV